MFTGLIAFPLTPADPSGRVDAAALRKIVRRLLDGQVDGVCVLGSTGVYAYLDRAERRRAVEAAAEEIDGRCPLLAGVGALRTDRAAALAEDARAAGADGGLLAAVSYTPPTEDEVVAHFAAVASAGLPLCVYDNPQTTHVEISDALLERLSGLSGVRAVKAPAPDGDEAPRRLAELRRCVPHDFKVGFSGDWRAGEALLAGGDAWYSVLAGLAPAPAHDLARAASAGDVSEVRRINDRLAPLWSLFQSFGSLRVMYEGARALGVYDGAPPRPLLPLPDAAGAQARAVFRTLREAGALGP